MEDSREGSILRHVKLEVGVRPLITERALRQVRAVDSNRMRDWKQKSNREKKAGSLSHALCSTFYSAILIFTAILAGFGNGKNRLLFRTVIVMLCFRANLRSVAFLVREKDP